ncbi:MAG: hypothetical protein JWN74_2756 [Acidobacteriaceae bacterium]|nr:hypothetical protein [Acidobacteriaceae bacterium]
MPNKALRAILEKNGEKDFELERCILVKIGAIQLEDGSRNAEQIAAPSGVAIGSEYCKALVKKLVKAVSLHPNVSEPIPLNNPDSTMTLTTPNFLITGEHFLFHITLPKSQLKYSDWFSSKRDMEDFYAIYTGSLFAAFREIEFLEQSGIGQEFREILFKQIPKETSIKVPSLGPTPLHPEFYIITGKSDTDTADTRPTIFCEREDLFIVLHNTKATDQEIVDAFLSSVQSRMLRLYSHLVAQDMVDLLAHEVAEHFSKLAGTARSLSNAQKWRFLRTRRLTQEARRELSSIHELLVERESLTLGFSQDRERFLQAIAEEPLLSKLQDYFKRTYDSATAVPQSLIPALNHFENELALALNIRTLFVATIVGALVGAVIGALLTWILSGPLETSRLQSKTNVKPTQNRESTAPPVSPDTHKH